jgi:hypothetical protein
VARWPWWHRGSGPNDYRVRELLRAIWDLHAMYGVDVPWLWRGQANAAFNLEPGMHTRVRAHATLDDPNIEEFTRGLLGAARSAELDRHEEMRLPDLALLALLQHHRAATPLMDVAKKAKTSVPTVKRRIAELVERGLLKRAGSGGHVQYRTTGLIEI